jgi:hypothetical protein
MTRDLTPDEAESLEDDRDSALLRQAIADSNDEFVGANELLAWGELSSWVKNLCCRLTQCLSLLTQ